MITLIGFYENELLEHAFISWPTYSSKTPDSRLNCFQHQWKMDKCIDKHHLDKKKEKNSMKYCHRIRKDEITIFFLLARETIRKENVQWNDALCMEINCLRGRKLDNVCCWILLECFQCMEILNVIGLGISSIASGTSIK